MIVLTALSVAALAFVIPMTCRAVRNLRSAWRDVTRPIP